MYSHTQKGWMMMAALAGAIAVIGAAAMKMPAGSPGMPFVYATMAAIALMMPLFGWRTGIIRRGSKFDVRSSTLKR